MRMEISFFFPIWSHIFLPFSLSFPTFSFAFFLRISYAGPCHLNRAWLVMTGLHYEGTMVNRTFLVRKFHHFFLTLEAFRVLPLHARELVSYYYYPAYYCIKWYWSWKIACINRCREGPLKSVGQLLLINTLPPSKGYTCGHKTVQTLMK